MWFEKFTRFIRRIGYSLSQTDHIMFYQHIEGGRVTILIIYVDDIIVTGNDVVEANKLKESLACEFEKKKFGKLEILPRYRSCKIRIRNIFIIKKIYIRSAKEYKSVRCKSIDTPIDATHKLRMNIESKAVNKENYQKLVGKLI